MIKGKKPDIGNTKEGPLVQIRGFRTLEEHCLYLIHLKAYETAAGMATGKVVLDAGCNIGYGTKVLSTRCRKAIGVDVSWRAINKARCDFGNAKTEFEVVDGIHLPFESAYFDMIVSFQVIEHIEDHTPYLREIKRVLKEDGIALFTTPNAKIRLDSDMKPFNPFHVREYSADELTTLLQPYFARVDIRGLFGSIPLYEVECQRIQRSRQKLRMRSSWINALSFYLRRHLPKRLIETMQTVSFLLRGKKSLPESILERSTGFAGSVL